MINKSYRAALFFIFIASKILYGQNGAEHTEIQRNAFDFWIGDWDIQEEILQQNGAWLPLRAATTVSPTLDSLALIEHWEGDVRFFWEGMQSPEHMKGLSVRSYDSHAGTWSIYWMDTRNPSFGQPYIGRFEKEKGEFFKEWDSPEGKRTGRITFISVAPDSVHWDLAVSKDDRTTWTTLWIMEMSRKEQ